MMQLLLKIILIGTIIALAALVLIFYVKGKKEEPLYFQTHKDTMAGGPFEVSSSTSRYALTEAIVTKHTFFLTLDQAKFSAPDVAYYKGNFISLFTPGVSFFGIPFYILGNLFHIPQLVTFFSTIFIALLNVILIALIIRKLGASILIGLFSGLIFLFATNALAYSLTLTQHHLSVFLVLLGILISLEKKSLLNNFVLGVLFGAAALVDIPNVLFFIPILLYTFSHHISLTQTQQEKLFSLNLKFIGIIIGMVPLLAIFAWYNFVTDGSYTKLAQFIGRTHYFQAIDQKQSISQQPTVQVSKETPTTMGLSLPFESRLQMNGLYTLLLSNERAWIYYSPIVLLGILGLYLLYKNPETRNQSILLASIISLDILLYSMFGDPWGGWAFGPRYLIPSAALLCVGLGQVIKQYKRNIFFILILSVLLIYSLWVSSMGALTTTAIPPKVEAQSLPTHIPYTYKYNQQLIQKNQINSLAYSLFFKNKMNGQKLLFGLTSLSLILFLFVYTFILMEKERRSNNS